MKQMAVFNNETCGQLKKWSPSFCDMSFNWLRPVFFNWPIAEDCDLGESSERLFIPPLTVFPWILMFLWTQEFQAVHQKNQNRGRNPIPWMSTNLLWKPWHPQSSDRWGTSFSQWFLCLNIPSPIPIQPVHWWQRPLLEFALDAYSEVALVLY